MRLLVWLIFGLIIYLAVQSRARAMRENLRKAVKAELDAQAASSMQQPRPAPPSENMVACAYCQIYIPASEAVHLVTPTADHYFCCEDHLRLNSNPSSPQSSASRE